MLSAGRMAGQSQRTFRAAWFASNGYACLVLDTLEFGEVAGIHHGIHDLNMWHWLSLGYTPAGTEVWNAIRALDYLETRPEVDKDRIGLTGISGGGAITWYTSAIDDRVKVAAPVCATWTVEQQIAVLLVGAGLLMHSFVRLTSVSPGFESGGRDGVLQTVRVTMPEHLYDRPERIHAFARGVLDRIQYLPGVKSASLINSPPFGLMFIQGDFFIEGQPKPKLHVGTPKIDAGYFRTMGIPLLAGREFTARDTAAAPKVAIVSERIVREYFHGGPREALGRRVRLGDRGEWLTVVGVVADIRQRGLDREVQPMLYVPFQQERGGFVRFVSFVARTATPASVAEGIRAEIRGAAPDLPIESTVTMDEAVAASVAEPRFRMLLLALFAIAATLIATCGIYGLMAYAVTQRRREIGVRMALGAERGDVLRLVLMRALRVVAAGVMLGLAGAFAVTRVLQTFLFGVTPTDPIAFTIVTLLLMTVALMAAWLPARRATRIDPSAALRAE